MGKLKPNKYFLYKNRFIIGYLLLALSFLGLLFFLPQIAPDGLSSSEISSAISSQNLNYHSILDGQFIDLPYHLVQKIVFKFFGITTFTIKLPSIIVGGILGILFILLLNRWFKNNTAIIASIITVLSSNFLFLAGSGTPLIMIVFWPTLLLWIGSKVQGKERPAPIWCLIFAFALFLSSFTPFMLYLVISILIYTVLHPHLRFTIKNLPKLPLFIVGIFILSGLSLIGFILLHHPTSIWELLFAKNFSLTDYFLHLRQAFLPFFSWHSIIESPFLSPQISLPATLIAIVGLISTFKGFFASRNSIALFLTLFTVIISGFHTDYAVLLILPFAILIAHGLRYIINKWYDLFPENPYAKLFGILPITIFLFIMITSDLSHFISGYRYTAPVANQFSNDLSLILKITENDDYLVLDQSQNSAKLLVAANNVRPLLAQPLNLQITNSADGFIPGTKFYSLGKIEPSSSLIIQKIFTSGKSQNADRLYQYLVE